MVPWLAPFTDRYRDFAAAALASSCLDFTARLTHLAGRKGIQEVEAGLGRPQRHLFRVLQKEDGARTHPLFE
jgi:hypothetical protein